MRPVSFLPPSAASVVMTASAIVGTAMNWNKRVNTVAIKLKSSFKGLIPSQPRAAPMTNAKIQRINCRPCFFVWCSFSTLCAKFLTSSFLFISFPPMTINEKEFSGRFYGCSKARETLPHRARSSFQTIKKPFLPHGTKDS